MTFLAPVARCRSSKLSQVLRACLAAAAQTAILAAQLTPPAAAASSSSEPQPQPQASLPLMPQQQREFEHVLQICQRVQKAIRRRMRRAAAAATGTSRESSCSGDSLGSLSSCDSFGARRHARRLQCALRRGEKQSALLERACDIGESSEETASEVSCDTAIFLGPASSQRPAARVQPTPSSGPAPTPYPQSSLRQQPIPESHELSGSQCQRLGASRPQFTYSKGLASYSSSPAHFPASKQLRTRPVPSACTSLDESQEIWVDGPLEMVVPASTVFHAPSAVPPSTPTYLCTNITPTAVHTGTGAYETAAVAGPVVSSSGSGSGSGSADEQQHELDAHEMVESQTSQSSQLSTSSLADKGTQCDEQYSESGSTSCSTSASASAPSESSVRLAHPPAHVQLLQNQGSSVSATEQSQDACAYRPAEAPSQAQGLAPAARSRAPLSDIEEGYEGALGTSTQTESGGSGSGSGLEAEAEPEPEAEAEQASEQEADEDQLPEPSIISNDERRLLGPVDENAESHYSEATSCSCAADMLLLRSCPPSISSTPLHHQLRSHDADASARDEDEDGDGDDEVESPDLRVGFEIGAPYENLRLIRRLTEKLTHDANATTRANAQLLAPGDGAYSGPGRVNQRDGAEDKRTVAVNELMSSTRLFENTPKPSGIHI